MICKNEFHENSCGSTFHRPLALGNISNTLSTKIDYFRLIATTFRHIIINGGYLVSPNQSSATGKSKSVA